MAIKKKDFKTNVPLRFTLRSVAPEPEESQFEGSSESSFRTDQGKMYVAEEVGAVLANQIANQGIQAGEAVEVCKREVETGNGRKGIRWFITRPQSAGAQPNGHFSVPSGSIPGTGVSAPAPVAPAASQPPVSSTGNGNSNGHANGNGHHTNGNGFLPQSAPDGTAVQAFYARLLSITNGMTDVYAAALKHAGQYGTNVKPEDVRTVLTTVYISLTNKKKEGNGHA